MQSFTKTLYAYVLSALFGMVGGLITVGIIWLLEATTKIVWEHGAGNNITDPSRTPFVFLSLFLAALVAGYFAKKYSKPLVGMNEVIDQIIDKGKIRWQDTGRAFINGLVSIASGASLGPEAPSAFISAGSASFIAEKTNQSPETTKIMNSGSVSGMLGTLLSSPFIAPALIAETAKGKLKNLPSMLTYSTVASAFGIGVFFGLFHTVSVINIGLPALSGTGLVALTQALCIGLSAAVFLGIASKLLAPLITFIVQPFHNKPFITAIVGGGIAALIAFCLPLTMFSGQYTVATLIEKSASFGIILLLAIALAKLFSTLLLLKSGFFGGPIFPMIFIGTTLGIIVTHIVAIPLTLAAAAAVAGMLTVAMRQPLSAALLTIGIIGTNVTTVVAVAVAGASLLLTLLPQASDNKVSYE